MRFERGDCRLSDGETLLSAVGCPLSAGGETIRLEEEILWTYPQGFAQPLPGEGA